MSKSFTKHKEYFALLEKCHEHLNQIKELSNRSLREFDQFVSTFNSSFSEDKLLQDKDFYYEAFKFSSSIRTIIKILKEFCFDLTTLRPLAISKDNEALIILLKAFKEFTSFTQKNFGPTLSSVLMKAKFVFDMVRESDM